MSSNKVIFKRSSVAGRVPTTESLDYGEVALNYADGRLYYKGSNNTIKFFEIGGNDSLSTVIDERQYIASPTNGEETYDVYYQTGFVSAYVNGVRLYSEDFTADDGYTVTITGLSAGDDVQLTGFRSFQTKIATKYDRQTHVATAGQTTFSVNYGIAVEGSFVQIFVNGILLKENEYAASTGTSIVLTDAAELDDVVECIGYKDFSILNLGASGEGIEYDPETGEITLLSSSNNDPSTLVLRDASGNFAANNVEFNQLIFSDASVQTTAYTDTRVGDYLTNNGYDTAANIVASIVDSSPATLDTLNELAAALGDDENFATTIANSIALKANTADLGTAAAEDVGYFATAAQGTLADSALQSVAFADLTSTPTTLAGYGITDAFDGAYSSLTGAPAIPSAITDLGITDGTIGQVLTTDGAGTFTFEDGATPTTVSGTAPSSPEEGDLWFDNVTTGQLYAYVGTSWLSTAGLTTLSFSSVGDLSDVDITTTAPTDGQALIWDSVTSKFIPGDVAVDFTGYATETYVNTAISTASSNYATAAQGALADTALQTTDLTGYATETYVGTAISNLIDSAPGALDTLNELAAALGDDANFATTTANAISLKANSADLGTAAAENVEYFATAAQGALSDTALQSVAFTDLTSTPTTLAGYGITDAATSAQGALADTALQATDLTGYATETYVGTAISNLIDTAPTTLDTLNELAAALGDDPNFATTVTNAIGLKANTADLGTAAAQNVEYFATAAQGALADSALQSVAFADLTSTPTTLAGYGITDSPSALTDLGIVDGTAGQVLTTDGAGGFTFEDGATPTTVSGTAPSSPEQGDLWFDNVTTGQLYTYVGTSWLSTAGLTTLEYSSVGDLSDVDLTVAPVTGQALVWNGTSFVPGDSFSQSDFDTAFAAKTTSDLSEGTNLYYTDARVDAAIAAALPTSILDLGITDGSDGQVLSANGDGTFTFIDNPTTIQSSYQKIVSNGSTSQFTLTQSVANASNIIVTVESVIQSPIDAYTVSGTTLTFTSNPPVGAIIIIRYINVYGNLEIPETASSAPTTSVTLIDAFPLADYRSGEYTISCESGSNYHTLKLMVIHDGSTVNYTQYGDIIMGSAVGTFTAQINGPDVEILFTGSSTNNTVTFKRILLSVA